MLARLGRVSPAAGRLMRHDAPSIAVLPGRLALVRLVTTHAAPVACTASRPRGARRCRWSSSTPRKAATAARPRIAGCRRPFRRRPSAAASVLAFHVDYWDRLGWKDRFALAAVHRAAARGDARERRAPSSTRRRSSCRAGRRSGQRAVAGRSAAAIAREPARADDRARCARARGRRDVRVRATVPDARAPAARGVWLALHRQRARDRRQGRARTVARG